jgi:hypothetical protein
VRCSSGTLGVVTTSRFDERLQPETYVNDDVRVRVAATQHNEDLWISERLWARLWDLGRANELHLLQLLDGAPEPITLSSAQASKLLDELAFAASVSKADEALAAELAKLLPLVARVAGSTGDEVLTVEGP